MNREVGTHGRKMLIQRLILHLSSLNLLLCCCKCTTITIGALVSSHTPIGKIAMQAIDVAVNSINQNTSVLQGYQLAVKMLDTKCNPFEGAVDAEELLEEEVVAIVGPQSSAVSQFVAQMAGATQVPLVSFAATDPALSWHQYPYFLRTSHSDAQQMQAIAAFIRAYGWNKVVAISSEDEFGRHGVAALRIALEKVRVNVVYQAVVSPFLNKTGMDTLLKKVSTLESRIYVLHMPQNMSLCLLSEAKQLQMMTSGYVWIVSDSTTGTLSSTVLDVSVLVTLNTVVGVRGYYQQDSPEFLTFLSEWSSRTAPDNSVGLHIYGLYAYDATWLLALALDSYLKEYGFNFTFHNPVYPTSASGGLAQLSVFDQGPILRKHILETQFQGASGYIQLDQRGDLVRSRFEFVNIVGGQLRIIGYWSNLTQLSVTPPVDYPVVSVTSQHYPFQVVWPGNSTTNPRGWVLSANGNPLRILVPKKFGFPQLLNWPNNGSSIFQGFCIDVFTSALKFLPYTVPYTFILYGNETTPIYDEMVQKIYDKTYDGIVGDFTITTKRMVKVDYTQPFVEAGLVVVVPLVKARENGAWAFLRPFTASMWLTTLAFFVFTGLVVWMLEHKKNREFRGHPSKQITTMLWFIFSTLVFAQREATKSTLGRMVVVIWLFVVLIITSSYTASLTTILSSRQLVGKISGIADLQASNEAVGYNKGSYIKDYLISINIPETRLKPYTSMDDYAAALRLGTIGGGIGAMVVGYPFAETFLDLHCEFTMAGQQFTKAGWGFIFPKGSEFAIDMSTAIMKLSETGVLQKIHDLWLQNTNCASHREIASSFQLSIDRFWGLFLVTGVASFVSIIVYIIRLLWQFTHRGDLAYTDYHSRRTLSGRTRSFLKSFASFMHEYGSRNERGSGEQSVSRGGSSSGFSVGSSRTSSIRSKSMMRSFSQYIARSEFDDPERSDSDDSNVDSTAQLVLKPRKTVDKSPSLHSIIESDETFATSGEISAASDQSDGRIVDSKQE